MKQGNFIQLAGKFWQAEVSLYGGQLWHAECQSSAYPVLFRSKMADAVPGKAIRGGCPVCWPWFGASPVEGRPIQGFARTAEWEVETLHSDFVRMKLPEKNVPSELRDFPFELFTEIRLSDCLEISLVMSCGGDVPVEISCALHTYFAVSDCEKLTVCGLENTPFTVKNGAEQPGEKTPLKIKNEVCRLYCPQTGVLTICDPEWQRRIIIEKINSASTLVWNPGAERCAQIGDLENDDFHRFLCVEANRAGSDTAILNPGTTLKLAQRISISDL